MGKNQKKKGKGAEKTAAKTDKKLTQKMKKQLAMAGEDDIEEIIAKIEQEEQKKLQVIVKVITPPTPRAFFSFNAHPFKEELIMFGGEFHNGQETLVYNDLFIYKIGRDEWSIVKGPSPPPPRTSHQAVTVASGKGELWVFGGEFTTKTESQFYHYKDLWVLDLESKIWSKVNAPGGPSARSGHRMVLLKRNLVVFGGYHDNLKDYKYYNDVHMFNLDDRKWTKIEPSGNPPCPRSGFQMVATSEGKIVIWGGYSKTRVKKDIDQGVTHSDMFLLSPDKNDTTGLKWKWSVVKPGGMRYESRSGVSVASWGDRAYTFGGAADQETDEEISTEFFNEFHSLDLKKFIWTRITLSGRKEGEKKKRRRKPKPEGGEESCSEEEEEEKMEEDVPNVQETVVDDGVFTMRVGLPTVGKSSDQESSAAPAIPQPHPRINCTLVVKGSKLYLYGGIYESGDREFTLSDFHCIDLHKLDEWKTLISCDLENQEWVQSGSDMDTDSGSDESDSDELDSEQEDST